MLHFVHFSSTCVNNPCSHLNARLAHPSQVRLLQRRGDCGVGARGGRLRREPGVRGGPLRLLPGRRHLLAGAQEPGLLRVPGGGKDNGFIEETE